MCKFLVAATLAACPLGLCACGADRAPLQPPTSPAPSPASAITIDVVGIDGAQSFSPNPATLPPGQRVVWHNVDTTPHRVVFDDGELDTGTIAPGAFSQPMIPLAPGPYHCSIHPPMVGTIAEGQ
jgi:plastocyanin